MVGQLATTDRRPVAVAAVIGAAAPVQRCRLQQAFDAPLEGHPHAVVDDTNREEGSRSWGHQSASLDEPD